MVFPAKYRRVVFDDSVDLCLKEICLDIENRYQIKFLEIGTDKNHVHFLVQSVPTYSVTKIVMMVKSLTAREIMNYPAASGRGINMKSISNSPQAAGNSTQRDSTAVPR